MAMIRIVLACALLVGCTHKINRDGGESLLIFCTFPCIVKQSSQSRIKSTVAVDGFSCKPGARNDQDH